MINTVKKFKNNILFILNNTHLVRKLFLEIKTNGILSAFKKANRYFKMLNIDTNYKPIILKVDTYLPIEFKNISSPKVSIIIPVYNNFDYTYHCLLAIHKHTPLDLVEIIIADDNSQDETINIKEYIKNITVIRNNQNLGFLKNCNNASKYAKGEFLVFLNNDTQVQPNWLEALLSCFEDPVVGLVGPKFVYEDGILQEAGAIIFQDGFAKRYGTLDNPLKPKYNYKKEVDYVSGACMLLRRELWEKLGGFDEYLAPAYYEDTDLAFCIRKLGLKVIYQPKAVSVHFESKSYTVKKETSILSNKQKFYEKWKDELKTYAPDESFVFLARDRSLNKKLVLIMDVVPLGHNAGFKAMINIMSTLKDMGFQVKFMPFYFNGFYYIDILQEMGIEVFYGEDFKNPKIFLKEYLKYFDFIILCRAFYAKYYIDTVLSFKNSNAKIFYLPHDISYLRLQREYEFKKEKSLLEEASRLKRLEYTLFDRSDGILLFSNFEKEIMSKDFPNKPMHVIPIFSYKETFPLTSADFSDRFGIFFIGGFGHKPNLDGVNWFLQNVWQKVKANMKDAVFYIAGSNIPDSLQNIKDNQIKVLGALEEKALKDMYNKVRLVIVPLTYGAGVKGKLIEAIAYGVPVVSTSIGAEGIKDVEDVILIKDSPKDFAESTIELYQNQELWYYYRQKQIEFANKYLHIKSLKKEFEKIFI